MKEQTQSRRKNYFIDKKFQSLFIIKFCALVVIGAVLSGVIIYLMSQATVTTSFDNLRLVIKSTADFILPAVLLSSIVVVMIIGIATIVITLFTSHKIAGPLYRVGKDIEEVAAGNLKKQFNLRKSDELKALAEVLNNLTQTLKGDVGKIKNDVNELESTIPQGEVKEKINKIKSVLDKYTT